MTTHRALLLALGAVLGAAAATRAAPDPAELAARIDKHLAAGWSEAGVAPAAPASDAEFLRRVTLDIAGRIPSVAEVRAFLADSRPDKRRRLVDTLLAGPGYVNHFSAAWRQLLLPETTNDFQYRIAVPAFEAWLRKQLVDNVGYDALVRELLTAPLARREASRTPRNPYDLVDGPTPLAFYLAKEGKPENLAGSTSRLFLGLKLECAQCHNHPFASWTKEQFWKYAAFFGGFNSQGPNNLFNLREDPDRRELTIPGGNRVVQASFPDGSAPKWNGKSTTRTVLAEWLTARDNPYFARNGANRLWAHFFGQGLVDPIDDFTEDNKPSHPALLDDLARGFADAGFDVKYLIRALTATQAYQLASGSDRPPEEGRLFERMAVKGLSPEQLYESFAQATGLRPQGPQRNPFAVGNDGSPRSEFLARFQLQEKRTEAQTSILQALALMNGRLVAEATSLDRSATLAAVADAPFLDTRGRVETLFLATLSRPPSPMESERFVRYVEGGGPKKNPRTALSDVFWALLNSSEFILNH